MLYVHKEIGGTRHKSTGPSFGFAVDRPIPLTLQKDQSALRASTARIFDLRVAPFDDGAILFNGLRLTGGTPQGLGYSGSYGEGASWSWSNPWVWFAVAVGGAMGISCATENWPCDDSYGGSDGYTPPRRMSRVLLLAVILAMLSGCVTLPRDVARELEPVAHEAAGSLQQTMSIVSRIVVALAAAWLGGCATTLQPTAYRTFDVESASAGELDFHGLPLQSGQLVVSDSGGPDSLLMSMLGEQYTPYGHAGILSIEDGKAYVYEGFALLWPFFSGPPTDAMRGRIRRVSLEQYIARQRVTAIFDPPADVDKAAVAAFARARHEDGTEFDPYFDWRDHDATVLHRVRSTGVARGRAAAADAGPRARQHVAARRAGLAEGAVRPRSSRRAR